MIYNDFDARHHTKKKKRKKKTNKSLTSLAQGVQIGHQNTTSVGISYDRSDMSMMDDLNLI